MSGLVEARRALGAIDQLPLEIVNVSRSTVLAAAHIKARFPISYADAFAVVAAQNHGGVVMTGDPEFRRLAAAAADEFFAQVLTATGRSARAARDVRQQLRAELGGLLHDCLADHLAKQRAGVAARGAGGALSHQHEVRPSTARGPWR